MINDRIILVTKTVIINANGYNHIPKLFIIFSIRTAPYLYKAKPANKLPNHGINSSVPAIKPFFHPLYAHKQAITIKKRSTGFILYKEESLNKKYARKG
jgi:hypothetical protein